MMVHRSYRSPECIQNKVHVILTEGRGGEVVICDRDDAEGHQVCDGDRSRFSGGRAGRGSGRRGVRILLASCGGRTLATHDELPGTKIYMMSVLLDKKNNRLLFSTLFFFLIMCGF